MPDGATGESIETRQSWIIAVTAVAMLALAAGGPLTVVIGWCRSARRSAPGGRCRRWPPRWPIWGPARAA
jgi:hypothetical protein